MDGLRLDLRRMLLLIRTLVVTVGPSLLRRLAGRGEDAEVIGARFRQALASLGITYIKLGQFLAMRFDILPEEVCRELARLFDDVPPLPAHVIRDLLETEFAKPVEEVFKEFEWSCIAAASVAQVHRATRQNGEVVAVKIQRPGIVRFFAADMRLLRRAARIGDYFQLLGTQSLVKALDEFERFTQREMDFTVEARTAVKLRQNAGPFEDAPHIHWDLTTARVLTMEFVDGYSLSEIIALVESGRTAQLQHMAPHLDLNRAVNNMARASLRQLFVTGFFHADPHPGNIIIRQDGTVVFIDFGIFGQLTDERRETFASYIEHIAMGNIEQSYRQFIHLLEPTSQTDMQQLKRDVHAIMHRWHEASLRSDSSLSERHLGTYFSEFIEAIRTNHVAMSMDTLLFWRALLTLDATALRFEVAFDLLTLLRQFFEETRPTPLQKMVCPVTDYALVRSLFDGSRESPDQATLLLNDFVRGHADAHFEVDSDPMAQYPMVHTSILVAAIAGTSLALLAVETPFSAAGQLVTAGIVLSLLGAALLRWARN
ncbi:ABC1 kinase family protein [Candidatus Entotheonella palauensis]|uniref:ABC1 kinase family protein n=1 Tax=Candidatus Entotheonella palauensis TaxID=93172 RepID=UPI000B7D2CBC|nr:AarF/UbiB family protein [Candidatus Entotheonella palauensis]